MKQALNIIFDGPPSHESGRFVEVETDDGKSINAGEWIERGDGLWALRITELPDSTSQQASRVDRATVGGIHEFCSNPECTDIKCKGECESARQFT